MLEKMRKIFNEIDPVGIFFEENVDEYDSEIKELISLSPDFNDSDILYKELHDIFIKYFEGVQINQDSLKELTGKLKQEFGTPLRISK